MVDFARLKRITPAETRWIPEDAADPDGPAFLLAPMYTPAWYRFRALRLQSPGYADLLEEQRRQSRARALLLPAASALSVDKQVHMDAMEQELLIEVLAETVLLDWRGQTIEGQPCPYDKNLALEMLRESEAFRDLIVSLSPLATLEADAAKNSVTVFGGL